MHHKKLSAGVALLVLNSVILSAAHAELVRGMEEQVYHQPWETDYVPTGKGWAVKAPSGSGNVVNIGRKTGSNGINYHGGPLILGTTNVYYIWYGNWTGNSATTLLPSLAAGLSGSPYFNINTTYYNGNSVFVSNSIVLKQNLMLNSYPYGTALSDADVAAVVNDALSAGALPVDTNAVYFVLTSADVTETSGFCTSYCAWHTHGTMSGEDIKYAFVGNPDQCPSACEAQTTSPNGNAGADGMANTLTHELEEAVTDPDLNAWYDVTGKENADKCAWQFGTTYAASNGSLANMNLGGLDYLIQENWLNASGGMCTLSH